MEETEKQIECKNCNKMIGESKFDLHEAFCLRNIIKCKKCDLPINKNEIELHEQEFHLQVPCTLCKQNIEKHLLDSHMENCEFKSQICQFCQMPIAKKDFNAHINKCGSRTEICKFCKQRIQLRSLLEHEDQCQIDQIAKKEQEKVNAHKKILEQQQQQIKKPNVPNVPIEKESSIFTNIKKTSKINPYQKSMGSQIEQKSIIKKQQYPKQQQSQQQQQQWKQQFQSQTAKTLYEEMLEKQLNNGMEQWEQFNDEQIPYQQEQNMDALMDLEYQFQQKGLKPQQQQAQKKKEIPQQQEYSEKIEQVDDSYLYEDQEIQKAIQESLNDKWKQPVIDLNATMNSEVFKQVLEKSKHQK